MLAEVIARLRSSLGKAGQARQALNRAGDLLDESNESLGYALTGSSDPEAEQVIGLFARLRAGLDETCRALTEAENRTGSYLDRLGPALASAIADPPPSSPGRIEQLRVELPPPVAQSAGQKTHGRWIDADGNTHAEVSGKDDKYDEAILLFKQMKARRIPLRAADVEMKLAAHMRKNGIRSVELVINHVPCEGPLGCDALIPVILPEGYSLTVYGANGFVREYQGGRTSKWLP